MIGAILMADGVTDILNNEAFTGSQQAAQDISSVVNQGFSFFISVVAFFMISVALLRNVLAGAYCAFPKFWDQVDEAHKQNEDKAFFESFNDTFKHQGYQKISMGTVKTVILRIIPNIKCLTEFADETQDSKKYFIRAIPEMLGVVCLGVFIYNGYWRDAAAKVADFGGTMFKRVLLQWDPVEAFDALTSSVGRPAFATDGSLDDLGKNKNALAEDIYRAVLTKYGDISSAAEKSSLAQQIDTIVDTIFSQSQGEELFSDNSARTYKHEVKYVMDFKEDNLKSGVSDDTTTAFQYLIGLKPTGSEAGNQESSTGNVGILEFSSVKDATKEAWQLLVSIASTKRNASGASVGGSGGSNGSGTTSQKSTGTLTIPMSGSFELYVHKNTPEPKGVSGVKFTKNDSGDKRVWIGEIQSGDKTAGESAGTMTISVDGKHTVSCDVVWGNSLSFSCSDSNVKFSNGDFTYAEPVGNNDDENKEDSN